jgi:bifunctional DNA-binding transcriptional regulator/antitoxin component of YhaV-PrlF toxin-antitoxin module
MRIKINTICPIKKFCYPYNLQKVRITMAKSTITAKGQTTVPADIRQSIGSAPGTRLVWHILSDGRVFVRFKNKTVADVKGLVKATKRKKLSVQEMRP